MENNLNFYRLPQEKCSCLDEDGFLTNIAKNYRVFYEGVKEGKDSSVVLNEMGVKRMCCRANFLSLPFQTMIDSSVDRYYNDLKGVEKKDTRKLKLGRKIFDFPSIVIE